MELAKDRYSVRSFTAQPVEKEKLDAILEAARVAPTACNFQPQRVKVITDSDGLSLVDECTPFRFGARCVLLVCYDKAVCWKRKYDGALSGDIDASIATTQMMLAVHELGLGSCWVMSFDPAKAKKLFTLPENIVPLAFLPIGYPSKDARPADGHSKKYSLDNMLI